MRSPELEANPELDFDAMLAAMLNNAPELTDDLLGGTFDSLAATAASQPDNELVVRHLQGLFEFAFESGYVDAAMQMAAALGAMACTHTHLQQTADQMGASIMSDRSNSHASHEDHTDEDDEDDKANDRGTARGRARHTQRHHRRRR